MASCCRWRFNVKTFGGSSFVSCIGSSNSMPPFGDGCSSLRWISSFPHQPYRNQSHVSEMAVPCTGDNRFKNHVGLIAESRVLLGRTGLAVAAWKLSRGNCVPARLSLCTRGCARMTLIQWQPTPEENREGASHQCSGKIQHTGWEPRKISSFSPILSVSY